MRWSGRQRAAVAGVVAMVAGMIALAPATTRPAGAADDLEKYQGDVKGVQVEATRSYDEGNDRTTFTFTLRLNEGERQVSHVLLMACPDIEIVSATGPDGPDATPKPASSTTPEEDGSIKDSPHVGIKFDPGFRGVYSITFAGNIAGADFVVKDGDGHKHFPSGEASDVCKSVTPSGDTTDTTTGEGTTDTTTGGGTTDTTTGGGTTDTTTGAATTPTTTGEDTSPTTAGSNPDSGPASNQDSQPGTQVQGAAETNAAGPGTDVLGTQLTAPEAQGANLPRTGPVLPPLLIPLGALLVALGRLVTTIGRRA